MSNLYRSILNAQGSSFASTNSFEFDGSTDYIDCGDNDNLSFGDTVNDLPFSISCWVNVSQLTTGHTLIRKRNDSTSVSTFEYQGYYNSSGAITFRIFDANSLNRRGRTTSTGLITTNTWNHIVFIYDGRGGSNASDGIKIYLNGLRVDNADDQKNTYTAMHNFNEPFLIGKTLTGNIDEVAIFNAELSASDVTTIYNGGIPNNLNDLSTPPLSWWRMGEAATWTGRNWDLIDQGSGGNNGFSDTLPAPPAQPSTNVPI